MTVLYLSVRYIGISYSIVVAQLRYPSLVPLTFERCEVLYVTQLWMGFVVNAMLNAIMVARLHAMYQRSRKMLIFLVITFMTVTAAQGVNSARGISSMVGMEVVLSSSTGGSLYTCGIGFAREQNYRLSGVRDPFLLVLILGIAWEVLILCLALRIVAKHARELQRSSTGWTAGGCITVLMETHVRYFIA